MKISEVSSKNLRVSNEKLNFSTENLGSAMNFVGYQMKIWDLDGLQ